MGHCVSNLYVANDIDEPRLRLARLLPRRRRDSCRRWLWRLVRLRFRGGLGHLGLGGVLVLKASLRRLQVSHTGGNFFLGSGILDSGLLRCLELHTSEICFSGRWHTLWWGITAYMLYVANVTDEPRHCVARRVRQQPA